MKDKYIFKSARLGFRNWDKTDLEEFSKLNADKEVMAHFPKILSEQETADFMFRLQKHFLDKGYTYFACQELDTQAFIGFIGLAYQEYQSDFTPAIDIGWRLKKSAWGKGYATEGAKRCLDYAFNHLNIQKIVAVCPLTNVKSEQVIKKIGMNRKGVFKHPKLTDYPELESCVWYDIEKKEN